MSENTKQIGSRQTDKVQADRVHTEQNIAKHSKTVVVYRFYICFYKFYIGFYRFYILYVMEKNPCALPVCLVRCFVRFALCAGLCAGLCVRLVR